MIETPAAETETAVKLLAHYQRTPQLFDECFADNGELRPHYASFLAALDSATLRRAAHEIGADLLGAAEQRLS